MFKITFGDGTVLSNLGVNGSYFYTTQALPENFFDGKLRDVTIARDGGDDTDTQPPASLGEHDIMKLETRHSSGGLNYFMLRDYTREELNAAKTAGEIAYIAMMSDIELPA